MIKPHSKILEKKIFITVENLLFAYLGRDETGAYILNNTSIPAQVAYLFEAVDPDERLIHIEWTSDDWALLWLIDDWKTSCIRNERIKTRSSLERNVLLNADEIYKMMLDSLGLEKKDLKAKTAIKLRRAIEARNMELIELLGVSSEIIAEFRHHLDNLETFTASAKPKQNETRHTQNIAEADQETTG